MKGKIQAQPIVNGPYRLLVLGVSSGFGLGYSPFAPGTAGSLLGLPLAVALLHLPTGWAFFVLAALLLVTIPLAHRAAEHWGESDCQKIVIDEVIGQALAMMGVAQLYQMGAGLRFESAWGHFLVGFILFRLFDITKPFPARTFDRMSSGWGVMMDDVVAGAYAALILKGLSKIWVLS